MRLPPSPPRRMVTAPQVGLAPSLRHSASALSTAVRAHRVLGLKVAAGALAVAIVALVNQQLAQRAEPGVESGQVVESGRNETVVYRQPASRPTYVQAELSDLITDDEDDAAYYPRTVQTIRFVNPNSQQANRAPATGDPTRLASREVFEPQPMVRVHGFVAFPAKQPDTAIPMVSPRKRDGGLMDEVDDYLWEVYQRLPVKKDSTGDFSWKDLAAAQRLDMSLQDYVIGGMDPNFRKQLYHAGRAMDAAGVQWSMLSAFRDDYRQRLASGFKASIGNSLHGGSRRTGGYGHGRAIDITSADGNNAEAVWEWIDKHGGEYGLRRPMPGPDPAHIQQTADTHRIVFSMNKKRIKSASNKMKRRHAAGAKKIKLARAR